ncbi:probable vesicular acetylcholine transporter-B [Spodoptera frugiperda]|uniref:Probable vesicular acetylcholine transporter-B n=1 Tax=Spodoptera frugiperda TaxID=7108 RepID=A0A9R0EYI9_SPOFR|nr:probable vesicular acetylcholine transporter-B [Spodoptera frugiperda]
MECSVVIAISGSHVGRHYCALTRKLDEEAHTRRRALIGSSHICCIAPRRAARYWRQYEAGGARCRRRARRAARRRPWRSYTSRSSWTTCCSPCWVSAGRCLHTVYCTLCTVYCTEWGPVCAVPIIPDWVRGEALALWTTRDAPLASLLNHTAQRAVAAGTPQGAGGGGGASQAVVGVVLGAKAAAQLLAAPLAGAAVCRRGAAPVLRAATATLAAAAVVFACVSGRGGWRAALVVAAGRAAHGAGAALAAVAGLALAARALAPPQRDRAIGALLGAVALGNYNVPRPRGRGRQCTDSPSCVAGVLVGYPFGGATYALWSRGAPFLLIAAALLADLALQYMFLDKEEYNRVSTSSFQLSSLLKRIRSGGTIVPPPRRAKRSASARALPTFSRSAPCEEGAGGVSWRGVWALAGRGGAGACAGAVLLTTSVMAALEPCLPLWLLHKFHAQRWLTGAVFVPDSAAYLLAASLLGGAARRLGAERVALAGQLGVALAALAVPHARTVAGLAAPHVALGAGLGAADAALVPALLARHPRREAHVAALLQAASSAAYALGPVLGGAVAWCVGFETAMRALGVLNLLYVGYLYRALAAHPLSPQWGASSPEEEDAECEEGAERLPLAPRQ